MKISSIKKYLRHQTIMGRKSTFANAFASALAPFDDYSMDTVSEAIRDLGQDPEGDLFCAYCGSAAATWDHVFNRVVGGEFTGHGHRIRNLVPCCRTCNERKGKRSWREWLTVLSPEDLDLRIKNFEQFLSKANAALISTEDMRRCASGELVRFFEIREQVFNLLKEADELAAVIRKSATS